MPKIRKLSQRRGWAWALAVGIVKPILLAITRRRWLDGEKIPATGGCVIVGNHLSHLDPLTFAHMLYDHGRLPRYLGKAEVFEFPVVGAIVRSAGQIPVSRLSADAAQSFDAAVEAVQRGECVVVYPEGTITREPDLWPMTGKTGAARIALATGCAVIPVAQWGVQDILAPYAKRVHVFPRRLITMKAGDPVDLSEYVGQPLTADVLRAATTRIMDDLTSLLEEIRGEKAPAERFDARARGVSQTGNPHAKTKRRRR